VKTCGDFSTVYNARSSGLWVTGSCRDRFEAHPQKEKKRKGNRSREYARAQILVDNTVVHSYPSIKVLFENEKNKHRSMKWTIQFVFIFLE
jgi:hypothetical protein